MHPLQQLFLTDKLSGIYSCCSANHFVISAAAERAVATNTLLLVESTANQVDQFGGYTGMTPLDFRNYVMKITKKAGLADNRVILGGDHLGPLSWSSLPAEEALSNACGLIEAYAKAGFTKIHLDTSMRLGDDNPNEPLEDELIAKRSVQLCSVFESTCTYTPVYVIGSEVPIPGGAHENEDNIAITTPEAFKKTVTLFKKEFENSGLKDAWGRVVGVVVQPGVEFSEKTVFYYNSLAAKNLTSALKKYDSLVFEGHSTDYQPKDCLRNMVHDGIRILKVGPALTFALREALFALEHIERELPFNFKYSNFRITLDNVMHQEPTQWIKHYHGNELELSFSRAFSFSDRTRYYLNHPMVVGAQNLLIDNLRKHSIPLSLLSQYLPQQYIHVCEGILENEPEALIKDRICDCIDDYLYATIP